MGRFARNKFPVGQPIKNGDEKLRIIFAELTKRRLIESDNREDLGQFIVSWSASKKSVGTITKELSNFNKSDGDMSKPVFGAFKAALGVSGDDVWFHGHHAGSQTAPEFDDEKFRCELTARLDKKHRTKNVDNPETNLDDAESGTPFRLEPVYDHPKERLLSRELGDVSLDVSTQRGPNCAIEFSVKKASIYGDDKTFFFGYPEAFIDIKVENNPRASFDHFYGRKDRQEFEAEDFADLNTLHVHKIRQIGTAGGQLRSFRICATAKSGASDEDSHMLHFRCEISDFGRFLNVADGDLVSATLKVPLRSEKVLIQPANDDTASSLKEEILVLLRERAFPTEFTRDGNEIRWITVDENDGIDIEIEVFTYNLILRKSVFKVVMNDQR